MAASRAAAHDDPTTDTGHPRRWWILALLCCALCITVIDETILYIAVPALFDELGATNSQAQWAIDAYVIVYAALLLPAGNLGDRYGRRTFLIIGLVVFSVASLGAAWAPDPGTLIVMRGVMAIGGAICMPQTLSIITEVFSPRQRGLAIGVWSGVAGIGIVSGPIIGGVLLEHFWWGSVFLVNVPLAAVLLVGAVVLLPNHRDRDAAPADVTGSITAVVALLGLMAAVIEAPGRGITHPIVLVGGSIGTVAAVLFVLVELRGARPMLDLTLLRIPRVAMSVLVIGGSFLALQGTNYALTQYLQLIQGRGAAQAGVIFAPTSIGWSIAAPFGSWAARRIGMRRLLVSTTVVLAGSYIAFGLCGPGTGTGVLLVIFAVQGVAMGLAMTPMTDLLMGSVPRSRSGVASALNDVSRQVGGAIGVAVFGAVVGAVFTSRMGPDGPENLGRALGGGYEAVAANARDAFMVGFRFAMFAAAALFVVLLPAIIRWGRSERDPGPP